MSKREIEIWFAILELEPTASFEEVKEQWRVLSLIWHPDRQAQGSRAHKMALDRQKELNNAYDGLKKWFASGGHSSSAPPPKSSSPPPKSSSPPPKSSSPPPWSSSSPPPKSPLQSSPLPPASDFEKASSGSVRTKKPSAFFLAIKEMLYEIHVFLGVGKEVEFPERERDTFLGEMRYIFRWSVKYLMLWSVAFGSVVVLCWSIIGIPVAIWLCIYYPFVLFDEFYIRSIIETPYMFTTHLTPDKVLQSIAATLGSANSAGTKWEIVSPSSDSALTAKLKYMDKGQASELDMHVNLFFEPPVCLVKIEFSLENCGPTPLAERIISYCVPAVRRGLEAAQSK